ncbi:hypothetical protein ACJZ2D_000874 [Fusarium nematophilum]
MAEFSYPGINVPLKHGFGRSNWSKSYPNYPIGFPEYSQEGWATILPMRKVAMMILMDNLTDKPNWSEKVFNEDIVLRWRNEAREQPENGLFARVMQEKEHKTIPKPISRIISEQTFDFCIAELRNKAKYFATSGLIPTLDSAGTSIVKSDSYIEKPLHHKLIQVFDALRADQRDNVDWHPRSNNMVQDLVHPSLYPFVYGTKGNPGLTTPTNYLQTAPDSYKKKLSAWVTPWTTLEKGQPSPKTKNPKGTASFGPPHTSGFLPTWLSGMMEPSKIYETLERVIDKAIPAWDQRLHEYTSWKKGPVAGRVSSRFHEITEASDSDDSLWAPELDVAKFKDLDVHLTNEELFELEDMACFEKRNAQLDWKAQHKRMDQGLPPLMPNVEDRHIARAKWEKVRVAKLPEPRDFEEIDYAPEESLREKFRENELQVIIKMASIELTPERPKFPAGGWHLEGQMNEKICATAVYYVNSDNVTPSHLSFRTQTDSYLNDRIHSDQDEFNWLERVYGTALRGYGNSACVQNFGDVQTRHGRLLAFPSIYQHRVSSFRLEDPSKPGHRRFIALWLIDPHRRIISTANVPPRQMDWWTDKFGSGESQGQAGFHVNLHPQGVDSEYYMRMTALWNRVVTEDGDVLIPESGRDNSFKDQALPGTDDLRLRWSFSFIPEADIPPRHMRHKSLAGAEGADDMWELARGWLDECCQSHKNYSVLSSSGCCPTRLVEIVNDSNVRVIECGRAKSSQRYAALSHCWGESATLKLLSGNKSRLETNINISELPQSYKEAVDVCLRMDIKYIWIDSLCIIQDSTDDWATYLYVADWSQ